MITIITACWRAENLPKVIESVDNQIFTDWHHILVNDGNLEVRDVFKGLCDGNKRHWVDLSTRCHYFGAVARNIGVVMAFSYLKERNLDNEMICFHDDDNLWQPNHLQSMVDVLKDNPQMTMVMSDAEWVGCKDKGWKEIRPCQFRHGGIDLGQILYHRDLFFKYGLFNPRPKRKQRYDWELIFKMIKGERGNIGFTHLPTFVMSYRKK